MKKIKESINCTRTVRNTSSNINCFATAPKGTCETITLAVIILKCQEKYSLVLTDIKYQLTNIKREKVQKEFYT